MSSFLNLTIILTFLLSLAPFGALVAGSSNVSRYPQAVRRPEVVERGPGPGENGVDHGTSPNKGFDNARFSYYVDGMGACGQFNYPGDFIVALNTPQWDGGSHCFASITITANGKTAQARIMDQCPGCPFAGLDFSQGLFDYFAPESAGIIYGHWEFGSGPSSRSAIVLDDKPAPPINLDQPLSGSSSTSSSTGSNTSSTTSQTYSMITTSSSGLLTATATPTSTLESASIVETVLVEASGSRNINPFTITLTAADDSLPTSMYDKVIVMSTTTIYKADLPIPTPGPPFTLRPGQGVVAGNVQAMNLANIQIGRMLEDAIIAGPESFDV